MSRSPVSKIPIKAIHIDACSTDERIESVTTKRLNSLVIKPIGSFCNLACQYCFYLEKHALYAGAVASHRMNEATLEKMIQDFFACSDQPTFIWHGGEPTVLGVAFFQKAVELQKRYAQGKAFFNAIQTHAGLIDDAWIDFLKQESFLVGISLDGPAHIHDRYRQDRRGHGTFEDTFANAQRLLKAGVEVNALVTVSDYAARYPKEIYRFLVENGFNFMQFSPVVERDPRNAKKAADFSVSATEYGRFLSQLFDCWYDDFDFANLRQKTSIRFFDSIMRCYLGMEPDQCVLHETCNDYLVVEHNGDLFSCDFLVSKSTHLGNLHQTELKTAFYSPQHIAFGAKKAQLDQECKQCKWLKQCYGGCIKDRIRDPLDKGHNHFCESYKILFKRTDERFKKLTALYNKYY